MSATAEVIIVILIVIIGLALFARWWTHMK